MMKYRVNKAYILIWGIFWGYGIYSFINYQNILEVKNTILGIFNMVSSGSGYGNYKLHSTIYIVIYVLFIKDIIGDFEIQEFVRLPRKKILNKNIKKIFTNTVKFELAYFSVRIVMVLLFFKFSIVKDFYYIQKEILYMFMVFIFYLMFGILYFLFYTVFLGQTISMVLTVFISVGCLSVADFFNIWTPLNLIGCADMIFSFSGFNMLEQISNIFIGCFIVCLLFILSSESLYRKDILVNESE